MRSRLDLEPPSLIRYLTPAARLADAILRATFVEGGFPQASRRNPSLVVVHGVRVADASTLHAAAQGLRDGEEEDAYRLDATVRDWTDLTSVRSDRVERLLDEASVARTMIGSAGRERRCPPSSGRSPTRSCPWRAEGSRLSNLSRRSASSYPTMPS
ncbi:hypothetical protein [Aurantimonas sp. Leaf443]|uniref:hypothetical protein n=1 Tax=Aurantimonas sp. Leaf443 TaxID=1736378 RepID=UPI0007014571|nr:hypothetical protein [Aurantimonas sp. Leaf443]KQT86841.1 hypothetical protein ASG48_17545 [Aurantimonas sp. Leaf443]